MKHFGQSSAICDSGKFLII
ncbi:hypothetical protein CGLO_10128 [Colletotrichum gloeosporioides Cg-14]|uniref:Uncharacterized protein n=1 Tax=Colletotrichum gloeosporioides (strain Cg-14) TaxID=1237896 RepID=T0LQG1_COLGC|nr:hypothetical protein CGLO_10128 [Colletotrichum gloeosporioides Cg-14]